MKQILTILMLMMAGCLVKAVMTEDVATNFVNHGQLISATNGLATTSYVNTATNNLMSVVASNFAPIHGATSNTFAATDLELTNLWYILPETTNDLYIYNLSGFSSYFLFSQYGSSNSIRFDGFANGNFAFLPITFPDGIITTTNKASWYVGNGVGLTNLNATNLIGTLTNSTTGNAASATTASGGWPTTWSPSSITAGNLPVTVTNIAPVVGSLITGSLTNNTTGSAASGWPTQWPWASITNPPSIPTTNGLAVTNGTYPNMTVGAATTASGGWPAYPTTNQFIDKVTATNIAAALTNQLVIPTTNGFIGLLQATNISSNMVYLGTNGLGAGGISLTQATNVALPTATNVFNGLIIGATNNLLPTMTNIATAVGGGILTNNYTFTTTSNPTNQYLVNVLYTNLTGYRALLVGSIYWRGNDNNIVILRYTNNATGFLLQLDCGYGLNTDSGNQPIIPFCVPLNTNATFKFITTGVEWPTNTVLWAAP